MRILWMAAVLSACDAGGGVSIDDFAGRVAVTLCARLDECCEPGERAWIPAEDCVAEASEWLDRELDLPDMREGIAAGRLSFDEAQAARCLEHVEALACPAFSAWLDEAQAATGLVCLDMLIGRVAPGGTCAEHYECTTGHCAFLPGDARQCAAPIARGGACDPTCEDRFECVRCEGDLLCDQATMTCAADPPIVPAAFCDGRQGS